MFCSIALGLAIETVDSLAAQGLAFLDIVLYVAKIFYAQLLYHRLYYKISALLLFPRLFFLYTTALCFLCGLSPFLYLSLLSSSNTRIPAILLFRLYWNNCNTAIIATFKTIHKCYRTSATAVTADRMAKLVLRYDEQGLQTARTAKIAE